MHSRAPGFPPQIFAYFGFADRTKLFHVKLWQVGWCGLTKRTSRQRGAVAEIKNFAPPDLGGKQTHGGKRAYIGASEIVSPAHTFPSATQPPQCGEPHWGRSSDLAHRKTDGGAPGSCLVWAKAQRIEYMLRTPIKPSCWRFY